MFDNSLQNIRVNKNRNNPLRKFNRKEMSPTSINISNSGTISKLSDNKISVISDRHYPKVT